MPVLHISMNAPVILSLETATMGGSVWLGFGEVELATRTGDPKVSQSATLLQDINDCLAEAGVKLTEVDLFACASGPGSFTGLRIGIATLKALAASLGRPSIGVPTLHTVAHAGGASPATVALLPAGRGELFAQLLSVSADGVVTELDTAAHLSPSNLLARYGERRNLKWAGNGAQVQRELIKNFAREQGLTFVEGLIREQLPETKRDTWILAAPETNLAKHVGAMALRLFQSNALQSPQSLKAIYVRPSDAELNQKCQ